MKRAPLFCRRRAVSIVELLIGVFLIFVLGSLLFLAVKPLSAYTARTRSLAYLRNLSLAMNQYATEHNELYPVSYRLSGGNETAWQSQIASYIFPGINGSPQGRYPLTRALEHRENIFISPTSRSVPSKSPSLWWISSTYSVHKGLTDSSEEGKNRPRRNRIVRPSEIILIGDSCQSKDGGGALPAFTQPNDCWLNVAAITDESLDRPIPVGPNTDSSEGHGWLAYRSNDRATVAMVDGSAKALSSGSVLYRNIVWDR